MRRAFTLLLFLLMVMSFSGCVKVIPKVYRYYPPESAADKKCVNTCYYARKKCLQICALKKNRLCDCTTSFNTCYSACGGQVVEHKAPKI